MQIKKKIIDQLIEKARSELQIAESAFKATKEFKNSEEAKAEGKYDTRKTEAGYLAEAQGRRVEEIKLEMQALKEIPDSRYEKNDEIAVGALVEIELNGKKRLYFLTATSGGNMIEADGMTIMVISVFSPIGNEILGLKLNDRFVLESPSGDREYKITDIK